MGKGSGWANWQARYGKGGRVTDTGAPGTTRASLEHFAESSTGPLQNSLFDQGLIDYNERGEIDVKPDTVATRAKEIVKESQDASLPRDYLIKSYQESARERGGTLSKQQAENAINKDQAIRAQAVIVAAQVGKVRLTPAQRARLDEIEQGNYLDLVYGQYKSGDRGTLLGVRDSKTIIKRNDSVEKQEKRREFMQFVAESRGSRAA